MAKRFTDTDKWKRPWFTKLSNEQKLVWFYILDLCDHTGVWHADVGLLNYHLKSRITVEKIESWFGDKMRRIDVDKYFIQSFVDFQYGELNPKNNAHKAVIEVVSNLAPGWLLNEPLIGGLLGAQDKDKDKDKDQDKDKEEVFDFEKIFLEYPKRPGTRKADGINSLSRQIKNQEHFDLCVAAAASYRKHCEQKKTEPEFIMQFKTWCGSVEKPTWREWIRSDEETREEYMRRNGIVER